MSYHRSHHLFFWRLLVRQERCRAIIPYQLIRNFLLGLTPPLPGSLLTTFVFFIRVIQSIPNLQHHVIPPPPDLYQSRQAYWGTRTPPPIATTTAFLPCPVPSSPLLLFMILVIQSIPNLQHHVIPPRPICTSHARHIGEPVRRRR